MNSDDGHGRRPEAGALDHERYTTTMMSRPSKRGSRRLRVSCILMSRRPLFGPSS